MGAVTGDLTDEEPSKKELTKAKKAAKKDEKKAANAAKKGDLIDKQKVESNEIQKLKDAGEIAYLAVTGDSTDEEPSKKELTKAKKAAKKKMKKRLPMRRKKET